MKNGFNYFRTFDGRSIRYCIRRDQGSGVSGSVVCLSGRSEFIEKYEETIDELTARGFHVYSFDWRGQGLSDRLLENRHKGYVEKFEDYVSDLSFFMEKCVTVRESGRIIILAHSMGAHIALRYLHHQHERIDKAVLLSPMIDIHTSPLPRRVMRFLVKLAVKAGYGEEYAAGSGDYVPGGRKYRNNRLTTDPDRFFETRVKLAKNPDLAIGGATYKWLDAAFDSMDVLNSPGYLKDISTTLLIVSSVEDRVVRREAQKRLCRLLPNCAMVDVPGARHEILRERDSLRARMWDAFDDFVNDETRR